MVAVTNEPQLPADPEELRKSAETLFRKCAKLRKQAREMAWRAHELLEKAAKLKVKMPPKSRRKKPAGGT